MWHNLLAAVALMLVFEGIVPFLSPKRWRFMLQVMMSKDDRAIRVVALMGMLAGLALLYLVQHLGNWFEVLD